MRLLRWWHRRQQLYAAAEAFLKRKLPDFMSEEALLETIRLDMQWRAFRRQLREVTNRVAN